MGTSVSLFATKTMSQRALLFTVYPHKQTNSGEKESPIVPLQRFQHDNLIAWIPVRML